MSKPIPHGFTAILLSALLTLITACNSSDSNNDRTEITATQNETQLTQFNQCDELKSYLISTSQKQNALLDYTQTLPVEIQDNFNSSPLPTTGSD
ncbi:MAG: hypothetical protein KZQ81_13035 [Candidatus Thiodiazotropha sp. (ex Rostrolucina anterorostrata)]|nr:hypothetical protein [Candidatus Thiodiazotropha sp. (ex Rostrolucina anterorostrata)]